MINFFITYSPRINAARSIRAYPISSCDCLTWVSQRNRVCCKALSSSGRFRACVWLLIYKGWLRSARQWRNCYCVGCWTWTWIGKDDRSYIRWSWKINVFRTRRAENKGNGREGSRWFWCRLPALPWTTGGGKLRSWNCRRRWFRWRNWVEYCQNVVLGEYCVIVLKEL